MSYGMEAFARALDQFRLNNRRYPTTEEGLQATLTSDLPT
ncbi:MAG: type II secretion system protein GspG [Burkholderiales bacterium]|nr:type II secretion system protein GspG [Burkholderiales bacterium]